MVECEKCKELNEKYGNKEYKAICWDCHDKSVDEYIRISHHLKNIKEWIKCINMKWF